MKPSVARLSHCSGRMGWPSGESHCPPSGKRVKAARFAARAADSAAIHYRMLNASKGAAVQGPGSFKYDTHLEGNSNSGHLYGTQLSAEQKWQLIESMKTL